MLNKRNLKDINTKPTQGMVSEARKGLEWRKEFGRGGTQVGISRARDIVNGKNLSISSIKRMFSFFSRHEVDKKAQGFRPGEKGYPSNGRIAWALWGGDAGFSWSRKKRNEINKIEEKRMKIGTIILDGIELPLYDSKEEAESQAKKLGGSGSHEHTVDGKTYYMPFDNHEKCKEMMQNKNNMHYDDEEEEEDRQLSGDVRKGLQKKVKDHNEDVSKLKKSWNPKVTLSKLEKVFRRGVGAYKTNPGSVRPSVKSPEQWAYARVNSFLYAIKNGRFRGGKHDTDLLPNNHPVKQKMKKEESNKYIMENKEIRVYQAKYHYGEEKEDKRVSGYAALFETDSREMGFIETIEKNAFDGRLEDNVILTFNHNQNMLLDRNKGGTLKLSIDERGLKYDATLPNTTVGKDVAELMKKGLLYESSFAFTVEEDDWSMSDGIARRKIQKIGKLVDVSIVGTGAYANTDVALRSLEDFKEEIESKEDESANMQQNTIQENTDSTKLLINELKLKKRRI